MYRKRKCQFVLLFVNPTAFHSTEQLTFNTVPITVYSWIPDTIPLLKPNKAKVVKSSSQDNLKDVILNCLRVGLNHFETARFYGSSEVQFVDALSGLIDDGTIKREEFIFQTKLVPNEKKEDFVKQWEATW